jgi:hypothetical protein
MKHGVSRGLRSLGLGVAGLLISTARLLAQGDGGQGNAKTSTVPTLGGVGILALAGALSVGGAWLLRHRDKQK